MSPHDHHPHDHPHDHEHGHDHLIGLLDHPHHHDHTPAVAEEPLDPASQSLADALRASFGVLKGLMLFVLVLFLFSGVYQVNNNQVGVQMRFGRQVGPPTEPGLHFAWPYPIDTIQKVETGQQKAVIDGFWLRLTEAEKTKPLTELSGKTGGLDPATDGALLTGDRAIMHLLLQVLYHVNDANSYVKNVSDEAKLIQTVVQQSAVAEAARSTADDIWKNPAQLVPGIRTRAQALLDALGSGIEIENLAVEQSHYPLQVSAEFIEVQNADNRMRDAIQTANKAREEILKGAAGAAWEEIYQQIERLDQVKDDARREEIVEQIGRLLVDKAAGKAGEKIKLAYGERDKIVAEAKAAAGFFLTMLDTYHESPQLVTDRLRLEMVGKVFDQPLLPTWWLPPGGNKFIILNKNPDLARAQETAEAKAKVKK